ncbi:MAG: FAD-dependent oxidoreductase, partial [Lachnospiraceae bacterium]|nr:FAD-dependent oxidoreductase [Lachnospiraceae bacterium]
MDNKYFEYYDSYDIAVIGAGHAGCEAALAASRLGYKTVIFGINIDSIANMACNPSIGGTAKGQLVREIDALGGEMGRAADLNAIQTKLLNKAKGPAVYSPRAQIDRKRYQMYMKNVLECQENLDLKQAEITRILVEKDESGKQYVTGVQTHLGGIYKCKCAIACTGTYLKGKIIIGDYS